MIKIYDDNGLPFFDATWIRDRRYAEQVLADTMQTSLRQANTAWQFEQIEAPSLIPSDLLSEEYTAEDLFLIPDWFLALKPETTASSYHYAKHLLGHQQAKPPLCVYQASKSFRRENDQVTKNVRLKEFYQMEFQCIVTDDTKMDYMDTNFLVYVEDAVQNLIGKNCQLVPSERLPSYSDKTIDIEVEVGDKWLEVASISKRHDVPFEWSVQYPPTSKDPQTTTIGKKLINYEFAFGLDRIVYAMQHRSDI